MTKLSTGPGRPTGPRADNDVYTALMCVAALFILVATVFVGWKAWDFFGSVLPPGGS